ncbi:MAG: transposase [Legionella sp.]
MSNDLTNFNYNEFKAEAIEKIQAGQPITGKGGILIKELLESALEGELDAHLLESRGAEVSNRRNGESSKQVQTRNDSSELFTPRDQEGSFEPEIVKKRQTVLNESLDNKVLGECLVASGSSCANVSIISTKRLLKTALCLSFISRL